MNLPPPLRPGDRIAVLSPSWAGPEHYPAVHELGLRRLREVFGLEPVEWPTTRRQGSLQERARDVTAAFADPSVAGVVATIGGDDQLRVLPHLDLDVLRANPKRFLGYSDNANLHHVLWGLGIGSAYGGSTMVQLARPGALHPATEQGLRLALLGTGEHRVPELDEWWDSDLPWHEPSSLTTPAPLEPAAPWEWHGPSTRVTGRSWGGCLEIVDFQLRAGRWLQPLEAYDGGVLLLETSEELPDATYVSRVLTGMGERGLLERFAAVLVAKPKTRSLEVARDDAARAAYREAQRDAVLQAVADYAAHAPVVLGLDFGHTEPQVPLPHGGLITVDPVSRTVTATW